jgi:hypothetical protein
MPQVPAVIDDRPLSADRVPTLTEVVELDLPVRPADPVDAPEDAVLLHEAEATEPPAATPQDGLAEAESPVVAATAATDPMPPAMADDFVLAGLETQDVAAPPEAAPQPPVAPVVASPCVEVTSGPLPAPRQPVVDVEAVVGQVLSELMPRIDMLLESRLREALAPALARAADGLIRDTRLNLAVAVRDLVQEAVDRALQRRADL